MIFTRLETEGSRARTMREREGVVKRGKRKYSRRDPCRSRSSQEFEFRASGGGMVTNKGAEKQKREEKR